MDDQNQQKKAYEVADISIKMYKKSLIFYILLIMGFIGSTTALYYYFVPNNSFHYNKVQKSKIPYSSRLQSNTTVQADMVELRQKEHNLTTQYHWLNSEKTRLSLPTKRAIEIVLQEGMKTSSGVEQSQ